ncbi:3-hydroxyacyl-ACP dehydratase FabZ family protein [Poriferisphaera corsica]|uniref:3-hydroxyacyl-ACP dehydratase FabZ family protein n=1 Tax=Poriferisphaera corsica TaxID=2528020 RepID=UPI00190CB7D5|nr:3-hydroxyacyl-ACP dehydratase FabZ family protein [Poriferisphaera corsica]
MRDVSFIESINPHRGCMRLLDGIIYEDIPTGELIAFKDIGDDEFWVPGHIPGRPIFPGVLMIEAAAQLASYMCLQKLVDQDFMGFAGVDSVKFRGQVRPGDRLHILIKETEFRRRRCVCKSQGLVDGNLVFEAIITGMPM